jgi:hypothetical protein
MGQENRSAIGDRHSTTMGTYNLSAIEWGWNTRLELIDLERPTANRICTIVDLHKKPPGSATKQSLFNALLYNHFMFAVGKF